MRNLEKCLLNGNSISYQTLHGNSIQFLLYNNLFEIDFSFFLTVFWGCYVHLRKKIKDPQIALFWILEH